MTGVMLRHVSDQVPIEDKPMAVFTDRPKFRAQHIVEFGARIGEADV